MIRIPLRWCAPVALLAACDAPVYFPKEPGPAPSDTAVPATGAGTATATGTGTGTGTATATGTGTGTGTASTVDGLPCSVESVTQVQLEVINNSGLPVDLFWLDFDCQPFFLGTLFDTQSLPQTSYATHSFYVEDVNGAKVAEITLDTTPTQTLTVTP